MTLVERINQDMVAAMKAKEAERLSTLRMAKTAFKNEEINLGHTLPDEDAVRVLQKLVKQRRDAVEQYTMGGRPELAAKEAAEIKVIETYLPATPDEAALTSIVETTIAELGATSAKEMGQVMKAVRAKLVGQAVDGSVISQLVKVRLSHQDS